MGIQVGIWNLDGSPIGASYLEKVSSIVSRYGADGDGCYVKEHVAILYHALHTTHESQREAQPQVLSSGSVITWDGRLDNREDLIRDLGGALPVDSTDLEIFSSAYEKWGTDCLAKIVGDWAVAIWEGDHRSLILARDFVGVRQLYYSIDESRIVWSTILDPLVTLGGKTLALNDEYIAGWLSFYPAAHLTPYTSIHAVPPSSFVRLEPAKCQIRKYWDFDPAKRIRYTADAEYEEHFRSLLRVAVQRRLRSNGAILAELSGGMDSSSVVCLADTIIASAGCPRLETVSFYSASEPNWNEQPFFSKIEQMRGRQGHHINLDSQKIFDLHSKGSPFQATPGSTVGWHNEAGRKLASILRTESIRVVLSGLGGDEVTGGVPTPIPELQDLLVTGHHAELMRQLRVWALNQRRPWIHLLWESLRGFLPSAIVGLTHSMKPVPWLNPGFVRRNRVALGGYQRRLKFFGALPSFQANVLALETLRRQRGCDALSSDPPFEKRYPYLDRDLLEFVYAIPRKQLVRAGQRRYLMRRALAGIVPDEILGRKRKAFIARGPRAAISSEWPSLAAFSQNLSSSRLGILEGESFSMCLQQAQNNAEAPLVRLMRTLFLELWLRNLHEHHIPVDIPDQFSDVADRHAAYAISG